MDNLIDILLLALALMCIKTCFDVVRRWWNGDDLVTRYVNLATKIQSAHDSVVDDNFELEGEPESKRISRKHGGNFRSYLVQMGKAKFGSPKQTEANRLVVRKYLYDLCTERGLIARHINDHLDIAVGLVFVPSENELLGLAMSLTSKTRIRGRTKKALCNDTPSVA